MTEGFFALDYIIKMLRQAVDFAEAERDFQPLRLLINDLDNTAKHYVIRGTLEYKRECAELNSASLREDADPGTRFPVDPRASKEKDLDEWQADAEATKESDRPR